MLFSDTNLSQRRAHSPDIIAAISVNGQERVNANPALSGMSVLKTIPSDSPQLIRQKEARAARKYIPIVLCRLMATSTKGIKRLEAISNGISRIRYAKKNDSIEHALSTYSWRDIEQTKEVRRVILHIPCKIHPVPTGTGRRYATAPQGTLSLG